MGSNTQGKGGQAKDLQCGPLNRDLCSTHLIVHRFAQLLGLLFSSAPFSCFLIRGTPAQAHT
jgi:hypothetical protein